MTRRAKIWRVVAVLFLVGNLAGGVVAALDGELLHTGVHAGLLLLGAYLVWRLAPRHRAILALSRELDDRLTHLEQSVDAVAIQIERIGEGQRFMTRFFTENGTPLATGEGAAEPIEIEPREAAPHDRRY